MVYINYSVDMLMSCIDWFIVMYDVLQ